jgi:hypothetical protein
MEQLGDETAFGFFNNLLSDQLVFRRANGTVTGKAEAGGFLDSLKGTSPFTSRGSENIDVAFVDDRALVTLIVQTTKADGTKGRYRNIRLFSHQGGDWKLDFRYNYPLATL